MSTKNAPNLDDAAMAAIMTQEDTGCLAMSRGGEPYAVPLSFAWLDGKIVCHCALTGLKLDVLRENPRACFVVSRHPDRTHPHHPEGECDYRFESVLSFGTARVVDDPAERLELLRAFKDHFYRRLGLSADAAPVTEEAARKCGVIEIAVERMTGRRRG